MIRKLLASQYIFLVGGFALAAALIPTVVGSGKPDWSTSALTGAVLLLYTVSFAAQRQWVSAAGLAANAALWAVLLGQVTL